MPMFLQARVFNKMKPLVNLLFSNKVKSNFCIVEDTITGEHYIPLSYINFPPSKHIFNHDLGILNLCRYCKSTLY